MMRSPVVLFMSVALVASWDACADLRVVVSPTCSPAVRAAADEFAKYHELVTGRRPPVDVRKSGDGPFVTIGVDPASFEGETDAYRVVSTDDGLSVLGRNGRSALYGVYDFYRTKCGCRWFWDGDVVPKARQVDLSGVDIAERSRFEYRATQYFAHRALKRFQAELWGLEDWKREIDWALKNRLNVIMLQTGVEDLFQRAFPEVVPYPDPAVTAETDGGPGYNVRTPLWSLPFRSQLRKSVLKYATDRGLMHPVVYGPRTHWYSRTPKEFLEKLKPDFMPQEVEHYSEPSGRLWDIRQEKWFDAYWKLTEAEIAAYGYSGLLFNPGFDERILFTNRAANVEAKITYLEKFNREAARRHPNAKLLIEGWDFFGQWTPEEVRRFTSVADPARTVFWNYTSDEDDMEGAPGVPRHNNFTQWGLTNSFPYVFGTMLALNRCSDIRGNYEKIRARERLVRDDPMCKGYVLWPEMSHSDPFAWWYFTESCWRFSDEPVDGMLSRFCRERYGERAVQMEPIWRKVVGFSGRMGWDHNFMDNLSDWYDYDGYVPRRNDASRWQGARKAMGEKYAAIPAHDVFVALSAVDWRGDFVRRDAIDIARTVIDRSLYTAFEDLMADYYDVSRGARTVECLKTDAARYVELVACLADVLDLHGDFSVAETWDAVNRVEKVRNPKGEHLLFENSACGYCRGFQSEYVRSMFLPLAREIAALLVSRAEKGDFSPLPAPTDYLAKLRSRAHPILDFSPDPSARTAANFRKAMERCAAATAPFVWTDRDPKPWKRLEVRIRSSADHSLQPSYYFCPDGLARGGEKVPLLVALHSWSYGYTGLDLASWALEEAQKRGWAMLYPHFRGPNWTPQACGSDLAVQDIADAVRWAIARGDVDPDRVYILGGSGGGHMALLMAGRHPGLWAGVYAACPPADLARWHAQCLAQPEGNSNRVYAKNLVDACGGTPAERPREYAKRSATTHLSAARGVPIQISTGIHDGHVFRGAEHSVPPGHSVRCFNILATPEDRISEADIAIMEKEERVPDHLRFKGADPFFSAGSLLLSRISGNVRLTLHDGGHAGNYAAGISWLARQRRHAPVDWDVAGGASGDLHTITR